MKMMKNFATQQLTKKQMNEVKGGANTTREEYCATVAMIMENAFQRQDWSPEQWTNTTAAFNKNCTAYGIYG